MSSSMEPSEPSWDKNAVLRGLVQRGHDALKDLGCLLEALPQYDRANMADGKYRNAVGNILACRDELLVLRRLCVQKGHDPFAAQETQALLRERTRQAHCYGKNLFELGRKSDDKWGGKLLRFAPGIASGKRELLSLLQEEEALKKSYVRLVPVFPARKAASIEASGLAPTSRKERKKAWLSQAVAWHSLRDELRQLFGRLLRVRKSIAHASGFGNYYEYLEAHRRASWIPEGYLGAPADTASSLLCALHEQRRSSLGVDRLRPFDINTRVWIGCSDKSSWQRGMGAVFQRTHLAFARSFSVMVSERLIDVDSSGHESCLPLLHSRRPYLQLKATLEPRALVAALHEIGHGMHLLEACAQKNPFHRRITPLAGELAALGMELLACANLEAFFEDKKTAAWFQRKHLESIVALFPTAMAVMTFERDLYQEGPESDWEQSFARIMQRHIGLIDYTGYEHILKQWCYRIPVLVVSPGYFYNYAVAQAGALSLFANCCNRDKAARKLLEFMRLGASLTDEALYERAGALIGENTVSAALAIIMKQIQELYVRGPLQEKK